MVASIEHSLHLPDGERGHLLVMLHGCVQPASELAIATRMNAAAAAKGWAVLWPQQSQAAHELRCWNWYLPDHQNRGAGEPAMLAELIRDVRAEHGLDRVFLGGISAGAAMSAVLAANYPEMITAIAMHSGIAFGAASTVAGALTAMRTGDLDPLALGVQANQAMGERARVIPTLVLHGRQDAALHPRNGTNLAGQWAVANAIALGKPAAIPSSRETTHREEGRYDATIVTYDDVDVEEWRIAPLGHAWSGGSAEATYTDPKGPDATRAVIDFFSRFSRP